MAKQSFKQQVIQQITDKAVQQAMSQKREQEMAQLQADYNAWKTQQDGIAQLQAEYDAWKSEQPIQQATVNEVKAVEKPRDIYLDRPGDKYDKKKAAEAISKRQAFLEDRREKQKEQIPSLISYEDYFRQQQNENMLASPKEKGIQQLVNLAEYQDKINKAEKKAKEDRNRELEQQILNADKYNTKSTQLTDEQRELEKQILNADKYQVNESSPEESRKKLSAFGWGVTKIPFLASELLANGIVDAGETLGQAGANVLDDLTGHHEDHENLQKVNDYWDAKREQVEDNIKWMHDSQRQSEEENPFAYGAGKMATQAALYTLTNPLFDKLGAAVGGSKAAGFVGNQIGQNLQDVALDTLPRYKELKDQGVPDDEIIKILEKEGAYNAAGNLVMGGIGEIPNLARSINEKQAARQAFTDNIVEGRKALDSIINEDADNIVRNAAKQAEDIAPNNIPSTEELRELEREANTIDEIEDYSRIWKREPVEDISKSNIPEEIENTAKTQRPEYPEDVQEKIASDFEEIYRAMDNMNQAAIDSKNAKVMEKFEKLQKSVFDYENKIWKSSDAEEINNAKKAADAARQSFIREMKKVDPNYKGDLTGTKLGNAQYRIPKGISDEEAEELVNDWVKQDLENPNRFVESVSKRNVPGANPLQTFADESTKEQWKTSKARTNTFENQGWGDQLPEKDFAYRVQHTAEQHNIKAERYKDSENIANDLLYKDYDTFDAADVKASMEEIQKLMDSDDVGTARRLAERLAYEGREGGRTVQAFREYNKNTVSGALRDASNAQEDFILEPWRSRNTKAREGNSRIARALADMGNKWKAAKEAPNLTHEQIKAGVRAEIEREVGSVEKYFNDNDIEFLTQMAEDKKIPVWQITSEIEHKLKTGNWYTLDESIELPKPTNKKLQNALNSLVTEQVRAEKPAPTLQQITEEVRNTLGKEAADFEGQFNDNDIEYLANLINNGTTKEELAHALDTRLATGSWGISDETLQEVNNIFKAISKYDVNSKQYVEGQAEAYRLLANEILPNATGLEKFEAWRYLAMLGNPKTMIRNLVGNTLFNLVTDVSNGFAAVGEAGVDKGIKKGKKALNKVFKTSFDDTKGIQRTKSLLNPVKDADLIKSAFEDANASRYRQIVGSKYEKFDKNTLRQSKSVFNNKLLKLYEKATDAGISDYGAVKTKYTTSLAGYLKANGYDTNIFKAEDELARLKNLGETRLLSDAENEAIERLTKETDALEKARDYALKQAEYATFHEDNKMAQVLSEWSKLSKEKGTGIGHVLIEGTIPFKKTPANVLRSGFEYSPLGAIDSLKKTGKLIYENTGKRAGNLADTYLNSAGKEVQKTLANDVIESWSKSLTGTGLAALGFYLYDKGTLLDSNKDTKYQDELEGLQNYSIKINGKTYTIDWAAPAAMPLLLGAEIAKVWNAEGKETENWYDNLDEYLNAVNMIAEPLVETSMLSGVRDNLKEIASSAKNGDYSGLLTTAGYNMATGYLSQAIPTLSGQIARTVDNTRRSSYTDKEGVAGALEKQFRKTMNKLPVLSTYNQPYVDTYGREQKNSPSDNPLINLAYQMASPGYLASVNTTDADIMSRGVYDISKNKNTLPEWKSYFKDSNGKRVSPEDYTKASKAYGQANYEIREALANDDWFNSLDDKQKEEIVKSINTVAEHTGNAAIDPEYSKDSKSYNAYKDGGIPKLLDYYKDEQAGDIAKESGLGATSKAYKEIKEDIKNGNTEEAEAKISDAQKITDAGISTYGYNAYKANKSRITNTDDWIKQYTAIDNSGNGDGFVNQDEFIQWVKKSGLSEEEAVKQAKIYGDWKKVPYLKKDGTWGFH